MPKNPVPRPVRAKVRLVSQCMRIGLSVFMGIFLILQNVLPAQTVSEHEDKSAKKPQPWPGGIIPYDFTKLNDDQKGTTLSGMKRWMDTGAQIIFRPRTNETEYVYFTGELAAGNNSSLTGYEKGKRAEVNITAFWWRQGEWMVVHELGHVLGFFHEHQRWDRDQYIAVHYENIKPGRAFDYDWVARRNWLVTTLPYDYRSIMHYRVCWASKCESECKDAIGSSPCSVLAPVDTKYDGVIGQWQDNRVSELDAERVRLVYGRRGSGSRPLSEDKSQK